MTESTTSATCPASAAVSARANPFHFNLVAGGILFAITVVAAMLRIPRLTEFPPNLAHIEGFHGLKALRILQGENAVFFPEDQGIEALLAYAIAPSISLLGRTVLAVRLPTSLASTGTVIVVFWLGWLLFSRDENW